MAQRNHNLLLKVLKNVYVDADEEMFHVVERPFELILTFSAFKKEILTKSRK
jgi:hypothetical protein